MEKDDERKEYLDQRKSYANEKSQQSNILDKYLLTISTGSFGLSFLFIEKIVKGQIIQPKVLVYSWIMFLFSIIFSLLSFVFSKHAFSKTIEEYDKMQENPDYEFKMPIANNFTIICNWYAFAFLVIGFATFIAFAYFNVMGE